MYGYANYFTYVPLREKYYSYTVVTITSLYH
jgi:hypothetical protein